MKTAFWLLTVCAACVIAGCEKHEQDASAGKSKEKAGDKNDEKATAKPEAESRVQHGTNGEVYIKIEGKLQQEIGLQTALLEAAKLSPSIKAYGRVLDPSGLAALTGDLVTAEAAQQASMAELNRLKTLAAQNNASQRALQAAEVTAVHDQAQVQSVRLKLLAGWGSAISQRTDLPQFVQELGTLSAALIEVQLPAGETPNGLPTGATISTLSQESAPPASVLGQAPSVDPQMQGRGFLLLVSPNTNGLAPGAAVTGFLDLPGEPRDGVLLPRSAIVRYTGLTWVYLQTAEELFKRVEVKLEKPLDKGWFGSGEIKPGDKVVTLGAQQLLSEELKEQSGGEE